MGERPMYEVVSDWIACRVSPATGRERREAGFKRVEYSHTFICGFTDVAGAPIEIREQDRIEIQSGPIPYTPAGMFDVVGIMVPRSLVEELLIVVQLVQVKEY